MDRLRVLHAAKRVAMLERTIDNYFRLLSAEVDELLNAAEITREEVYKNGRVENGKDEGTTGAS